MTEELSKEMERVLVAMLDPENTTAYKCRTTMKTINALYERGLIRRINNNTVVWLGWESTGFLVRLTELGRTLAERLKEGS